MFALIAEHFSYALSFAVLSACSIGAAAVLWTQVRHTLKGMNKAYVAEAT